MRVAAEFHKSESPAPCPITGEPAARLIQTVPVRLLRRIWRYIGQTDVSGLFAGLDHVSLWESPCGLAFFSPAIAGDDDFYKTLYTRFKAHRALAEVAPVRPEFIAAARHVAEGALVLDVGAGCAGFGLHLEHARFAGLDPYAGPEEIAAGVIREEADDHAAAHREHYDVVSAFQVMEHTVDPVAFARTLTRMLKPGGHLILGVPLWPSPVTRSPNMLINCPPHHLTWWNEGPLSALAGKLGLEVVELERLPSHKHLGWVHWAMKLTWVDMRAKFYADRLAWHANTAVATALGLLFGHLLGVPRNAEPVDIIMVARKPVAG